MEAVSPHITPWPERSSAFADALLDPDTLIPIGIGKQAAPAPKRFSVYRNNVVVSLMEALASAYPSTKALLGNENFDRISRAYVGHNPPKSPMMQLYGSDFSDFMQKLPALSELPFLPDLARVEKAWNDAYHALDDTPLAAEDLQELSPEESMQLTLIPSRATALISSPWCIYDLFQARFEAIDDDTDFDRPQNVLITRNDLSVEYYSLPDGDTACMNALMSGLALGEAVGAAMAVQSDYNPAGLIGLCLQSQTFQSTRTTLP